MNNLSNASPEEATIKAITYKKTIAHRYIKKNYKTPVRIENENPDKGEVIQCITIEDANTLLENYGKFCECQFYEKHKTYIPNAEKRMEGLTSNLIENSINDYIAQNSKPVSELKTMMEDSKQPLLCIGEAAANSACMLIHARTQVALLVKYWKDLPDGKELLRIADNNFEELCSTLKIGRRTRAIISRKKTIESN